MYEQGEVYLSSAAKLQFADAIRANNVQQVEKLSKLDARLLVNVPLDVSLANFGAFHIAAQFASLEMTKLVLTLLKQKSKLDTLKKPDNWNPVQLDADLIATVQEKSVPMDHVTLLLQLGANPNVKINNSKPLLYLCTELGNAVLVDLLLKKQAKPDYIYATDEKKQGPTSLCVACALGHVAIAKSLIDAGATTTALSGYRSPMYYAISFNQTPLVQVLLEHGGVTAKYKDEQQVQSGETLLHVACKLGRLQIAQLLLAKSADLIGVKDAHDRTVLHHAILNGNLALVKLLVEKGANVAIKDKQGASALHYAIQWNHVDIVRYLLNQAQAQTSVQDDNGASPLHYAVHFGRTACVMLLVTAKANVNAPDNYFKTPLHYVAHVDPKSREAIEIINYLVCKIVSSYIMYSLITVQTTMPRTLMVKLRQHLHVNVAEPIWVI